VGGLKNTESIVFEFRNSQQHRLVCVVHSHEQFISELPFRIKQQRRGHDPDFSLFL